MPALCIARALAGGLLAAVFAAGAAAQQPFTAHANISVTNSSPVPQMVTGSNVPPFELLPHQHAQLKMAVTVPPPPGGEGTFPVRFDYAVGTLPGPQCHGTIDMTVSVTGSRTGGDEATHCTARSLGLGGAVCNIAVSARSSTCIGGLAFVAH